MTRKEQILQEVEKTLLSYEQDPVFEANPFLMTRIKAGIDDKPVKKRKLLEVSTPRAVIIFLLLINLLTVVFYYRNSQKYELREKLVRELRNDYQLDQSGQNL